MKSARPPRAASSRGDSGTVPAKGRYYDASDLFDDKLVLVIRLTPRLRMGRSGAVLGRLGTTLGDVEGFDVGLGLAWEL